MMTTPLLLVAILAGEGQTPTPEAGHAISWAEIKTRGDWIGADDRGFWASTGEHFSFEGTADVALSPPPSGLGRGSLAVLDDGVAVASTGGSGVLTIARYARDGRLRWQKDFGGKREDSSVTSVEACSAGPKGTVVVAGHFSGCITFGVQGQRCVDAKAAARHDAKMCSGEHCTQPFLLTVDRNGAVATFAGAPGVPSRRATIGSDGTVYLGGAVSDDVELGRTAGGSATVRLSKTDRRAAPHAFVGARKVAEKDGWLWARAVLGERPTGLDDFGASGPEGLWLGVDVGVGKGPCCVLSGSTPAQPLDLPAGACKVLVNVSPAGMVMARRSVCAANPSYGFRDADEARVSLFPTAAGMFAAGPFSSMANVSAESVDADAGRWGPEQVLIQLNASWAIRVPHASRVGAVAPHDGQICVAFALAGKRRLLGARKMTEVGSPQGLTRMIGCFPADTGSRHPSAN